MFDSGKMIIFVATLTFLIIYNSYGANLIAFITSANHALPFNNIEV